MDSVQSSCECKEETSFLSGYSLIDTCLYGYLSGWDFHDKMYPEESTYCTTEEGFKDLLACIDLSSFRRISWEDNLPLFLVNFQDEEGKSLKICPRSLLKDVVQKARTQLGCESLAGVEFEVSQLFFPESMMTCSDRHDAVLSLCRNGTKYGR